VTLSTRIKDLPNRERPRERLAELGPDALSDVELIAILLRTGLQGKSAVDVGAELVRQFGTLSALSQATLEELQTIKGIGRDKAIALQSAFTLARRMAAEIREAAPVLDTPESVANFLREECRPYKVEHFYAIFVNTRRRLIRKVHLTNGTLDAAIVHPRDVFRHAVAANASAVILVHNHPSGDPTPSKADITVTRDLVRAGQLLKIEVLDHVILGQRTTDRERDYFSLKEHGYIYK
jgi:DNA repair protein RadC|tara:strand:+ start:1620 stop:2330 length:711 start_codon:yes stop_codon:yes gene_type:complete